MPSAASSSKSKANPAASVSIEPRQMIKEDGSFVDVPHELLRQPPPKPTEFLYFQHYYERPPSLREDLKKCKTTEEAVDLLATELEIMHALVSGYVKNLNTATARFDEDIAKVHEEHMSLEDNLFFCQHMVEHTNQVLTQLQYGYSLLKAKVDLKVSQHSDLKKLPIIKPSKGRLHLVTNPEMTPAQKTRNNDHFSRIQQTRSEAFLVKSAEAYCHERAMVEELAHPELRPSKSSEKRKATGETSRAQSANGPPFEPHVRVKVQKLTDGLETMRETFKRVQGKTEKEYEKLRFLSASAAKDAAEFWEVYDDVSNRAALENGEWVKHIKRTHAAFTDWAERPTTSNAAGTDSPTPAANDPSSAAYPTPSSSQTPDADAPQKPNSHVLPFASDPSTSAYAVRITVDHQKPVDELTRDEAIALLKALPQQLEFVPHRAIEALQTEQQLAKIAAAEAGIQTSLEVLADKLEADVGLRFHPNTPPLPIVPEKRTEVYEERFPDDSAPPPSRPAKGKGKGKASATKPSVAARAKSAVAGILPSSATVDKEGKSRKRRRDPEADQAAGNSVKAEDLPARSTKSQKHKRARKA